MDSNKIFDNINKHIIINNVDIDNIDIILDDIIEIHNKKFDIYYVKCSFKIKFNINDIYELDTIYINNKEIYKIFIQLLFFIDMMIGDEKDFVNIDQMIVYINSDLCNMSDVYSRYMRLNPIEKQINIIFSRNPDLLKQISNNILIKNKNHILFNI